MRISDWSSDVCSSDLRIADDQREESAQRFVDARMLRRLAPRRIGDEKGQPQADGQNGCGIKDAQAPCDRGARQLRRDAGSEVEVRSEEHTSELQSLMRISYAVFCLKKKTHT